MNARPPWLVSGKQTAGIVVRRRIFLALVLATMAGLTTALASVFAIEGLTGFEIAMIILFALNTPWLSIGFWNAVIGVVVLHASRHWLPHVLPIQGLDAGDAAISSRTAVVMPVYNETSDRVVQHLKAVARSLDATGEADHYELFLLSDSDRPDIVAQETQLFERWQAEDPRPDRLHYRHRRYNVRQKVGNIEDFCERWGDRFDYMIVLDADSLMSGDVIGRLVRLMQANPTLGILQSLVCGLPASSAFTRVFQFGMRHGMRVYTTGSAWWQADQGPYWGHNAIVRLVPFRKFCRLPTLPGRPPLGGEILSHDQVEAVLMRRAGYEVRVLPIETGSFEANPPTLQDYLKRDLRWCQGNLQYFRLLGMPGILPLGRLQLLLAIMMYTAAPVWYAFMLIGLAQFVWYALTTKTTLHDELIGPLLGPGEFPIGGAILFVTILLMNFAPKILGVADVFLKPRERARYGGGGALLAGALVEGVFGMILAPIVALAQTIFIVGLSFGRRISWNGQTRDDRLVSVREAITGLWPQTLMGCVFAAGLWMYAPEFLIWGAPVILGLIMAVPFACALSGKTWSRAFERRRMCAIPEERELPPELLWTGYGSLRLDEARNAPESGLRPLPDTGLH